MSPEHETMEDLLQKLTKEWIKSQLDDENRTDQSVILLDSKTIQLLLLMVLARELKNDGTKPNEPIPQAIHDALDHALDTQQEKFETLLKTLQEIYFQD
ncbi:hypothetical protein WAK64_08490 [Bacillus spongiae]|uniref:Uncharacterized protein n=1 Tax=Bacillus spongiae TaxID=2683610 RepID=A0ABU8HD25_9BACI